MCVTVSSSLGECVEVFESYRDDVDRECNNQGSSFLFFCILVVKVGRSLCLVSSIWYWGIECV